MSNPTPQKQFAGFLAAYDPAIAKQARAVLKRLRTRCAGALELVYDNYNALAIGFSPTERASDVILSIALYPRWISLFFMQGKGLPDPARLMKGSGSKVRHVVLDGAERLDDPALSVLIGEALARARVPLDPAQKRRLIVKSVSAKQRPRRPAR